MAPTVPFPGGLNRLGKPSVKHLECYWWKTRGVCRFSEEECLYAHHETGRTAEAPRAVIPGEPARAGRSLDEARQRLEEAQAKRTIANPYGRPQDNPATTLPPVPTFPSLHQLTLTQQEGPQQSRGISSSQAGPFPQVSRSYLPVTAADVRASSQAAQSYPTVTAPTAGLSVRAPRSYGPVSSPQAGPSTRVGPNIGVSAGGQPQNIQRLTFSAPSNYGAVQAADPPASPTPLPLSARSYNTVRTTSSESTDSFVHYGKTRTPTHSKASRDTSATYFGRGHVNVPASDEFTPTGQRHLRTTIEEQAKQIALLTHEFNGLRMTNDRLTKELSTTQRDNGALRGRINSLENALNRAHELRNPISGFGHPEQHDSQGGAADNANLPYETFTRSQITEMSRQFMEISQALEHTQAALHHTQWENLELRQLAASLGRRV